MFQFRPAVTRGVHCPTLSIRRAQPACCSHSVAGTSRHCLLHPSLLSDGDEPSHAPSGGWGLSCLSPCPFIYPALEVKARLLE